jgi:hypothetical protein
MLSTSASDGASSSTSRLAFRYSWGSSSSRSRMTFDPLRQAAYSSPTSRVESARREIPAASRSHSRPLARAIGRRGFIAACGEIRPSRTSSCTGAGSSRTRPKRRDTQLGLRSSCLASSSWLLPRLVCSSSSSHPCSSADSASSQRRLRARSSASASPSSHTAAVTMSLPKRLRARTRLYPSITTYRPGSPGEAITTIGTCCPCSESEPRSLLSLPGRRTRSPS